jgi:hypothetical protein
VRHVQALGDCLRVVARSGERNHLPLATRETPERRGVSTFARVRGSEINATGDCLLDHPGEMRDVELAVLAHERPAVPLLGRDDILDTRHRMLREDHDRQLGLHRTQRETEVDAVDLPRAEIEVEQRQVHLGAADHADRIARVRTGHHGTHHAELRELRRKEVAQHRIVLDVEDAEVLGQRRGDGLHVCGPVSLRMTGRVLRSVVDEPIIPAQRRESHSVTPITLHV